MANSRKEKKECIKKKKKFEEKKQRNKTYLKGQRGG